MKDIVEKILKEEQIASSMVERSRIDADNNILQAKKEAADIINETIVKTKDLARQKKEEAEKKFLSEKEKILKEVKLDLGSLREKKEKDVIEKAKRVFFQIINIED